MATSPRSPSLRTTASSSPSGLHSRPADVVACRRGRRSGALPWTRPRRRPDPAEAVVASSCPSPLGSSHWMTSSSQRCPIMARRSPVSISEMDTAPPPLLTTRLRLSGVNSAVRIDSKGTARHVRPFGAPGGAGVPDLHRGDRGVAGHQPFAIGRERHAVDTLARVLRREGHQFRGPSSVTSQIRAVPSALAVARRVESGLQSRLLTVACGR